MDSEKRIGNYIVGEMIGRGGMGVVYRGRHAKLPREVAVKSISARGRHDLRRLRHRFEREAFVQSQLDHPAIVKIYDYIVSEQTYYIVMEYVEGRSLAQLIAQEGGPLQVERALDIFEQILEAIAYAHGFVYRDESGDTHRGIVHRDLKPPNIMVAPGDRVKITDFGIVKLVGSDTADTSGIAYGSPRYVSPEQAIGENLDQRSDIYSLGVILYEMLTGAPPFGGKTDEAVAPKRSEILRAHVEQPPRPPSEIVQGITPEVEKVICRALEKKRERRFATAAEFYRALRRARGRETGDIAVATSPPVETSPIHIDTEDIGATTGDMLRDEYHTQPIQPTVCGVCASEAEPEDKVCRVCGHDLTASPATSNLTRREITARQGAGSRRIIWPLVALVVLSLPLIYFFRRAGQELPGGAGGTATPQATVAASPVAPPVPAPLVPLGGSVKVDSSYDGYNAKALTDGVTDVRQVGSMRYNGGNWVSAERPEPHWIEVTLDGHSRVSSVYVFWGFDRGRYMPSRLVELQVPDGRGGWRTLSQLESGANYDRTAFEFEPVEASSLRILQPAQQGPPNRPFVMWVREVQIFGVPSTAKS
ncbi:MAG TPA: protein kinase [Pyrinomonadaceae bacterium]|jgi:serine/threonine protein kinase|nr:protein kinase [Pyrinomonadaceae bacterium]